MQLCTYVYLCTYTAHQGLCNNYEMIVLLIIIEMRIDITVAALLLYFINYLCSLR